MEENTAVNASQQSTFSQQYWERKCQDMEKQIGILVETIKELRGLLKNQDEDGKRNKILVDKQC